MNKPHRTNRVLHKLFTMPSVVSLALWQLRQTWRLLLVVGIGMIAAVMLASTAPLYSKVVATAGLRSTMTANPANTYLTVGGSGSQVDPRILSDTTKKLNQGVHDILGPYLTDPPQFSLQLTNLSFTDFGRFNSMNIFGFPIDQAAHHVKLIQGRLPLVNSTVLEVAITSTEAADLNAHIGSQFNTEVAFLNPVHNTRTMVPLPVHVVGIVTILPHDEFWHGNDFQPIESSPGSLSSSYDFYGLASNDTLATVMMHMSNAPQLAGTILDGSNVVLLYWYYHLDVTHINTDNVDELVDGINMFLAQYTSNNGFSVAYPPYIDSVTTNYPVDIFATYKTHLSIVQVPVECLIFLLLGVILLFISMMAALLVERHAEAIAILRSRGASHFQVFLALALQSVTIAGVAFIVGPFLAIAAVQFAILHTLPAADQSALNVLPTDPLQVFVETSGLNLAALVIALLAMLIALYSASRQDVLSIRREAARASRHPLWQVLRLDVVAIVIALVGYFFAHSYTNSSILDSRTRLLVLAPLTIVGAVFLMIAGILLFMRLYPWLLRLGTLITVRRRDAAPQLALAQMARTPRHPIHMTLLLAVATAFAIFALTFTASQEQRVYDVTSYQSGADFSGDNSNAYSASDLANRTAAYLHISGVTSATLGYTASASASTNNFSIPMELRAVDAHTFAKTAIWGGQESSQSLASLMQQIIALRPTALSRQIVPAIVDSQVWSELHLSDNEGFSLNLDQGAVSMLAVAEVQHIPTTGDGTLAGGILIDYQSFAAVYAKQFLTTLPINYVWLRTSDDPIALANVRKTLQGNSDLKLNSLNDRRATATAMSSEPLYLDLIGILAIGAITATLLALGGNLIASWLNTRGRMTNFSVLRALGLSPRQIANMLIWEQGVIYASALLLGICFGGLLSQQIIPALVFTSVIPGNFTDSISSQSIFIAQNTPPIQLIIPPTLILALLVLAAICVLVVIMMVILISRQSVSQALRLNED